MNSKDTNSEDMNSEDMILKDMNTEDMNAEEMNAEFIKKIKQVSATNKIGNLLKERTNDGTKLFEEHILLIESKTSLSRIEIKQQFELFQTFCPSGSFTKERLDNIFRSVYPEKILKIAADQIYETFDIDGEGDIDFTEFTIGCHNFENSSVKEKLHKVFELFDSDKSGFIRLKDMVEMFGTLYGNEGLDKKLAVERAYTIFALLDTGRVGEVSEEEFIAGCINDENIFESLTTEV